MFVDFREGFEGFVLNHFLPISSLVAQKAKNLLAMQETLV